MRRLLTASIFGTILTLTGAYSTANASIVSSGFLDEKLTEYALSTSLDLKANQSDLTALSNKIGTLPDGMTFANLYDGWTTPSGERIRGLSWIAQNDFTTYDHISDAAVNGPKPESRGSLEVLSRLLLDNGYEDSKNGVLAPFWYLTKQALRVGEIPRGKTVAGMIDEINTKIGTLPSGDVVNSALADTLNRFVQGTDNPVYPDSLAKLIEQIYGNTPEHPGILTYIFHGYPNPGPAVIPIGIGSPTIGILPAMELAERANNLANANTAKIGTVPGGKNLAGMISETDAKIGTLLSGNIVTSPLADTLNRYVQDTDDPVYPDSITKLIRQIYGTSPVHPGILTYILHGFTNPSPAVTQIGSQFIGIVPAMQIAERADDIANANTAKIGTVPDGKNLAGMISETDAKIGTLPAGYDSVGAALSAIKGIAEDAKAAALAAIPDPKQEGSSGKYVLTVDIVGDNATYHWEKIDREGETTTTTE